ncbi:MAG: hypothetical protein GY822_31220, partial [Deltaproteobacteria bacterium]|nr:hypothetical protein [Deltaproteobacteria bacterium]
TVQTLRAVLDDWSKSSPGRACDDRGVRRVHFLEREADHRDHKDVKGENARPVGACSDRNGEKVRFQKEKANDDRRLESPWLGGQNERQGIAIVDLKSNPWKNIPHSNITQGAFCIAREPRFATRGELED